jgi:hypothetical protein
VWNIAPVLLDPNTGGGLYQWHDGAVSSVDAVYDNGVLLSAGIDYTANNAAGTLTLSARPVGTVTLDGRGALYSGVWASTAGKIATALIVDVFGEVEAYLDLAAFAAIDAAKPYEIGLYIPDRANLLDVLDSVFSSVGAWYYWDGVAAKLTAGLITNPTGAAAAYSWSSMNIARDGLKVYLSESKPQYRTRLGYARCWTVQTADQLAASVTDPAFGSPDDVAFVGNEYREMVFTSTSTINVYPRAVDPQRVDTLISLDTDALTESQARQAILGAQVMFIEADDIAGDLGVMPGDFLSVTDSDFGLTGGRNVQVLEVTKQVLENTTSIRGWFAAANVFCLDYAELQDYYSLDLGFFPCQQYFTSEGGLSTVL